ncbi:MAG: phosphoribosylformylglycinamidine synthase subunit PurL [Candidatus Dormibacteraeota bacterium]|nr:phosphoribosylformylglycinamidine synthase subunit PurL [Candidatus Dormibacteraeota bacterium]
MTGPTATELREIALSRQEYERAIALLGRQPNALELGMLGAMWSEHCSYKTSKRLLRRLPSRGGAVVQGPGENAGVIDLGGSLLCCFKIESHNHPSAIEPLQGAATGVGGILRDVFAMGARPIALLDAIRFGDLSQGLQRHRFARVVEGVGFYGNCIGVPTVGGETYFDEAYSGNCLVNAMCVGVTTPEQLVRAVARGPGNPVLLVGADTGRDGIHGATFASVQLDQDAAERRPAVQVGNPFLEKCLMEACLELCSNRALVGLQDCGAAGLTSSLVEMAHRGGLGVELDVALVGRREEGMSPYEVMLSESQERMVLVVESGRELEVQAVFDRWGLRSDVIGRVIEEPVVRILERSEEVACLPLEVLVEGFLERRPAARRPDGLTARMGRDPLSAEPAWDLRDAWVRLLSSPNCGDPTWVFRQYDHQVGNDTVGGPGLDAAVLRFKNRPDGLALTVDGAHRCAALDPRRGTEMAVAEGLRNLAAVGAEPMALTNCLNFGDPDQPEVMWQLEEAVAGLAGAAEALGLPVVSGNVSLYNDYQGMGIPPTPVIGMVGRVDMVRPPVGRGFKHVGDRIVLIGNLGESLAGSEYQRLLQAGVEGPVPELDLAAEAASAGVVRELVRTAVVSSAHDLSIGGFAVALAECCVQHGLGATVDLALPPCPPGRPSRHHGALFGEDPGRYLLSLPEVRLADLAAVCGLRGVEWRDLGPVGGDSIRILGLVEMSCAEAGAALHGAIASRMGPL